MRILKRAGAIMLCFAALIAAAPFSVQAKAVTRSAIRVGSSSSPQHGPGMQSLGGAEIMLLQNQTDSQMMSYIITTNTGELIVVDGGLPEDAQHLSDIIKSKGGKVSAWLITHPHSDHVGAITKLINEGMNGISVEGVYYKYMDMDWYIRNEAYRSQMVADSAAAFAKLDPSVRHGEIKKGDVIEVGNAKIHVLNDPYQFTVNAINNSSVAYRIDINGKRILFLGDMGPEAGESLKNELPPEELRADYVQMAHHGQYGVNKDVYELIRPKVCMWNAPSWLWDNDNGAGKGSGTYLTLEVRAWMEELGVKSHYVIKDGDQTIK